jgi:hypothetical protein
MIFLEEFFKKYDLEEKKKFIENYVCATLRSQDEIDGKKVGLLLARKPTDPDLTLADWDIKNNSFIHEKSNWYLYDLDSKYVLSHLVNLNGKEFFIDMIKEKSVLTLFDKKCIDDSKDSTAEVDVDVEIEQDLNSNVNVEQFTRVINIVSELYQINPKWFITSLIELNSDIKTNRKMVDLIPNKLNRKKMYSAISFFDKLHKKGVGFNKAYKIAAEENGVSETLLRKFVGSRNGFKNIKI